MIRFRGYWLILLVCLQWASANAASWIWHPGLDSDQESPQEVLFRRTFTAPPLLWKAVLTVAAGAPAEVFLNGKVVATVESGNRPVRLEVTVRMNQGTNVLAARVQPPQGEAGLLVLLEMQGTTGGRELESDATWRCSLTEKPGWNDLGFSDAQWRRVGVLGQLGDLPWGDVLQRPTATPAHAIQTAPGFQVELIRSALPEEGSWICMTIDDRGRLILSPEREEHRLLRFTLDPGGKVAGIEPVADDLRHAMGLLYAHGSLYVNGHGPEGTGLYRLIDGNGNDQFEADEVHLLKSFIGEGEHGYHAVEVGPDGMIYVLNGNATRLPRDREASSPLSNYSGDRLPLVRQEPGQRPRLLAAPGGHILRTDPDGKQWELLLGGFRNPYDFAIDSEGEIFTFDSDLEWDWGAPWYRPNRVFHCIPGGDYGWREGRHKLDPDYPDVLPPAVDVGIGSPTGMKFGTGSRFPGRYRQALFAQDWSYGRLLAIHLEPHGATYQATYETVLSGSPLNLTDMEFGRDGALYFITGGRGTQSGLYRFWWNGGEAPPDAVVMSQAESASVRQAKEARELRRHLERYQVQATPDAVREIWPHLGSPDRWIRYAARVALERQPIAVWQERAWAETDLRTRLTVLLALARVAPSHQQARLLHALLEIPSLTLDTDQTVDWLRVFEVSFYRQGWPGDGLAVEVMERLDGLYPAGGWRVNRDLSRLLVYLEDPRFVTKTLALLAAAPTQEQQIHYIAMLRGVSQGWTLPQRETYFRWFLQDRTQLRHPPELLAWFREVDRPYVDGAHLHLILEAFRSEAMDQLSESELESLAAVLALRDADPALAPSMDRSFVRDWKVDEVVGDLDQVRSGRDFERGRRAFVDAQCLACHRFANAGGAVGPELDGVGKKYAARDILESILEPSKVISEQYQNTNFVLDDDEAEDNEVTGMIVGESDEEITLIVNGLTNLRRTIEASQVLERSVSKLSPMPSGLVTILEHDEILDLLAYLIAGGDPNDPRFKSEE